MANSGLGQLVNFKNKKGLELIGLLFKSIEKSNDIIIHVHGNFGNFYNNKFIWEMSKTYPLNYIDFLSFNLSAHDGLCEGYRNGSLDYVGGAKADYSESILDIDAAVSFAQQLGYKNIILQGHSLGCDKALDYVLHYCGMVKGLIMLSPVDSYAVQSKWLKIHRRGETIENQLHRISEYKKSGDENINWLDLTEYGAEGTDKDWIYRIPITAETLVSILGGSAFKYLNLETNGEGFYVGTPSFAYLGKRDGLQMSTQFEFSQFLQHHFSNICINDILNADHDIIGVEKELTESIVKWLRKRL